MRILLSVVASLVVLLACFADQPEKPVEQGTLILVDGRGKEQRITNWTWKMGTRRLSWLAPPVKGKEKATPAPEALIVRDEMKFNFLAGVVTLVPLDRLRSMRFEKDKLTVRAATGPKLEKDAILIGTTAYRGINKFTLEADVDKGEAGVASLTYQGGVPGGVQSIRFPESKVPEFKPGRPAIVVTLDRDVETTHKVSDLKALYQRAGGGEMLSPILPFRKTLKLDVAKLKSIQATDAEGDEPIWRVVQKDGEDLTLTLLSATTLDGSKATLLGLLGEVPCGYKLIPIKRVKSITFDVSEPNKKKVEF